MSVLFHKCSMCGINFSLPECVESTFNKQQCASGILINIPCPQCSDSSQPFIKDIPEPPITLPDGYF